MAVNFGFILLHVCRCH